MAFFVTARSNDTKAVGGAPEAPRDALIATPIGIIRTPFPDRAAAPRQPPAAAGAQGTIELVPDGRFEHALADLDRFSRIWVLFWFHLNTSWHAKVLPPRSAVRRGVFATRSPHRPNPIGMSVLRLERVDTERLTLDVLDVDMIDGTPVLDIKPYVPYADAVPDAGHGWLVEVNEASGAPSDPGPSHDVYYAELARDQLAFLKQRFGIDLEPRITDMLTIGPSPHPYRRIKKDGDGFRLAVRAWRVRFRVVERTVTVERIATGYRPSVLFSSEDPSLDVHRAFVEAFGA